MCSLFTYNENINVLIDPDNIDQNYSAAFHVISVPIWMEFLFHGNCRFLIINDNDNDVDNNNNSNDD